MNFSSGEVLIAGNAAFAEFHADFANVHLMSIEGNRLGFEEPAVLIGPGKLHVYGTDLRIEDGGPNIGWDVIRGYLADGDEFHGAFYGDPSLVVLHEVPEPSAITLAVIGLTTFVATRRFTRTRRK